MIIDIGNSAVRQDADFDALCETVYPQAFSGPRRSAAAGVFLKDPAIRKVVEFFEAKGLPALKEEDRLEQWYEDWLAYQAKHHLYASVLSPKQYSTMGFEFNLLKLTRFLEVFAYFSPAHGYSLQCTFLGLFPILMGSNSALKQEAVSALEAGGLLALGVSEKEHGSDLLANEFSVTETGPERFLANGKKYYIGNCNSASIISILARKQDHRSAGRARRALPVLFALRPKQARAFGGVRKIRTLGVRAAFVGEFEVKDHELAGSDLAADGRDAWDALAGTIVLGKFFLGFGAIGICEHALQEATAHLRRRILFGRPVLEMPHIRAAMAMAYARLTAMKLYAYRAVDYVQAASAADRRYLLFNAVQKAKVGTEGLRVVALLSECIGAKGFESDTYFEMALRDARLIPSLEGSTHVNYGLTAQFIPRYFDGHNENLSGPPSLLAGECAATENAYLMEARSGAVNTITFPHFLEAYQPLMAVPNVRTFVKQVKSFRLFVRRRRTTAIAANTEVSLRLGQCLATVAYAQLVAENSVRLNLPPQMVSAVFHALVSDLSALALLLASHPGMDAVGRVLVRRVVGVPRTTDVEWGFASRRVASMGGDPEPDNGQGPKSHGDGSATLNRRSAV